jgi:hypothetical protein
MNPNGIPNSKYENLLVERDRLLQEKNELVIENAELVEALKSTLPWLTSHPNECASQAYLAVRLAIDKAGQKGE